MSYTSPGPWHFRHDEPFETSLVDDNGDRVYGVKTWLDDACDDRNDVALANGRLVGAAFDFREVAREVNRAVALAVGSPDPSDSAAPCVITLTVGTIQRLRAACSKADHGEIE